MHHEGLLMNSEFAEKLMWQYVKKQQTSKSHLENKKNIKKPKICIF